MASGLSVRMAADAVSPPTATTASMFTSAAAMASQWSASAPGSSFIMILYSFMRPSRGLSTFNLSKTVRTSDFPGPQYFLNYPAIGGFYQQRSGCRRHLVPLAGQVVDEILRARIVAQYHRRAFAQNALQLD